MRGRGAAREGPALTLEAVAATVLQRHPDALVRTVVAGFAWLPGGEGPMERLGIAARPDRWQVFGVLDRDDGNSICLTLTSPRLRGRAEPGAWMATLLQHLADVIVEQDVPLPTSTALRFEINEKDWAGLVIVHDPEFGRADVMRVRLPRRTIAQLEAGAVGRIAEEGAQAAFDRRHQEPTTEHRYARGNVERTKPAGSMNAVLILMLLGIGSVIALMLGASGETDHEREQRRLRHAAFSRAPTPQRDILERIGRDDSYDSLGAEFIRKYGVSVDQLSRRLEAERERRKATREPAKAKNLSLDGAPFDHGTAVGCIAASPDGSLLATADATGVLRTLDAETGVHLSAHDAARGSISGLRFSPSGVRLAAWSKTAGSVAVLDVENDSVRLLPLEPADGIVDDAAVLDVSWISERIVAVSRMIGPTVLVAVEGEAPTTQPIRVFGTERTLMAAAISRDGRTRLYSGALGGVMVGPGDHTDQRVLERAGLGFTNFEFALWDGREGRPQTAVVVVRTDPRPGSGDTRSRVLAFDVAAGATRWNRVVPSRQFGLTVASDGRHAAILDATSCRVLDMRDGETVHLQQTPTSEPLTSVAFGADDGLVWIGTASGKVQRSTWSDDE